MKKIIRQIFIQNYKVKLLSLICALFLWFYVNLENEYEHIFFISLKTINQPQDKILIEPLPISIPVRYQGRGMAFINPKFRSQHFEIDLSLYTENTVISPTIDMIKGDQSYEEVRPIRIEHKGKISIVYDQYISKKVPVVSSIQLKPKEGYTQVGEVMFTPDSVTLQGAAKEVETISVVQTESKVMQVYKSINGVIDLVDSTSTFVTMSDKNVRFFADIQGIGDRMFVDVPVEVINSPSGEKVSAVPSTLSIRLQGGVEVLKHLKKEDIVATIDYRNRYRYGRRIPAMIHVPPTVSFTEVKPRDFELLVER